MTVIQLRDFHGMIPKLPAQALPEGHAQYASNCKAGHVELRPMIEPGFVAGPMNTLAKGIYSEDGRNFYTWPYDVFTARGPVASDVHKRMYWTIAEPGQSPGFHCWDTNSMSPQGGSPPRAPFVGVPAPTVGPLLKPNNSVPFPGVTSYTVVINLWYEKDGHRYQYTEDVPFIEGSTVNGFYWVVTATPDISAVPVTKQNLQVYMKAIFTGTSTSDGTTFDAELQVNGMVQILAADQVQIVSVGDPHDVNPGQIVEHVLQFQDANGVPQFLVDFVQTQQDAFGTPSDAILVFELLVTDTSGGDSSKLLDLVTASSVSSSSSSIADAGTIPTLIATLDDAFADYPPDWHNAYILTVQWPIFETRAYVYTIINAWDEESEPSPPELISVTYPQQVDVVIQSNNNPTYVDQLKARIYRTATTTQGQTNYQFVGDLDMSFSGQPTQGVIFTFNDNVTGDKLEEVIPSIGWTCPPLNLQCITAMPNGIMAAFTGNSLYFCDPYHPFAWPEDYIITLPYDIVGMVAHGNGLLVTTKGYPYMVYGVHPEGMSTQKLPILQAGLSARGIVDMGTAVAYVCRDGICVVQGGVGTMQYSESLFTRKDWRDKYDSNGYSLTQMKLAIYDGAIVAIFPAQNGFIIKLDDEAGFYSESTTKADATYLLPQTDLYYLGVGNSIYAYGEGGNPLQLTWQSKDFVLERPSNFGVVQVVADQVPNLFFPSGIVLQVYGDGQLIFDQPIQLTAPSQSISRRLPSGQKFRRYSVKIEGFGYIKEVYLASVPSELQHA